MLSWTTPCWPGNQVRLLLLVCLFVACLVGCCSFLTSELNAGKQWKQRVEQLALEEARKEGLENDPAVTEKDSPFFGKLQEYAVDQLNFYLCDVCKQPYYGGTWRVCLCLL